MKNKERVEIYGIDLQDMDFSIFDQDYSPDINFIKLSLLDKAALEGVLLSTQPDYIIHLASLSSVARSWEEPSSSMVNNLDIFVNLLEAVRRNRLSKTKILSIGSCEQYGRFRGEDLPLVEEMSMNPLNPYAVARVAQEHFAKIYYESYSIQVIMTRSFNHIGVGQEATFAVSSFVKQAVGVELGRQSKIACGNISAVRDLLDVRDVVRAYDLLLMKGRAGHIYNVCSGHGYMLSDIIEIISSNICRKIAYQEDARLIRPLDIPVVVGSNVKLNIATGFSAAYSLSDSISGMIEYWRNMLSREDRKVACRI